MLSGYTFSNGSDIEIPGSMVNRGAVSATLQPGKSYSIPAGYHNGNGKITAAPIGSNYVEGTLPVATTKTNAEWVKVLKAEGISYFSDDIAVNYSESKSVAISSAERSALILITNPNGPSVSTSMYNNSTYIISYSEQSNTIHYSSVINDKIILTAHTSKVLRTNNHGTINWNGEKYDYLYSKWLLHFDGKNLYLLEVYTGIAETKATYSSDWLSSSARYVYRLASGSVDYVGSLGSYGSTHTMPGAYFVAI